jgi:hypothetical protein
MHLVAMSQNVNFNELFTVVTRWRTTVTKYRRKCITAPMLERLREITEQRAGGAKGGALCAKSGRRAS